MGELEKDWEAKPISDRLLRKRICPILTRKEKFMLLYFLLNQKPVRVRTLQTFSGKNPWTLASDEEWSLELFRLAVPSMNQGYNPEALSGETSSTLTPKAPVPLKMGELLALRSNSDGKIYFLPHSLLGFYQEGLIPAHDLPKTLKHLGKVGKYDFVSPFRNKFIGGTGVFFISMFIFILWGIFHDMQLEQVWRAILLMGGIMSPILIAGLVFLIMGVSRLYRRSNQARLIRQFLQDKE